jgi:hypothetical protein
MPKKEVISTKKYVVEDVSENESDSDYSENISDNDTKNDSDSGAESESEQKEQLIKEKKEKKEKPTFEEIYRDIDILTKEEIQIDNEIQELHKQLSSKEKQKTANKKQRNKLIALLPKGYEDGCNKARKEKKKRTNSGKNGILKEVPVPPLLTKFLNLPEGTQLMRPKVFSLLNKKFIELGLKKGQSTVLDKKTAKVFGLEEGYEIEFDKCQSFLAKIYNDAKPKVTEISL